MKWTTGTVQVTGSIPTLSSTANLNSFEVSQSTTMTVSIIPTGYVYGSGNFWLEVISDGVVDLTSAMPLTGSPRGTTTPTRIGIQGIVIKNSTDASPVTITFIQPVKNRAWAQSGQLLVKIYDNLNAIAQESPPIPITILPASTLPATISVTPTLLGSASSVDYSFTSTAPYPPGTIAQLTTPSTFTKGAVTCLINLTPSTCNVSGDIIEITNMNIGTTIASGTVFTIRLQNMISPYCQANSNWNLKVTEPSVNKYIINNSAGTLDATGFTQDALVMSAINPLSSVAGDTNTIDIEFNHAVVIQANSIIRMTLHVDMIWTVGTSSCNIVSGLSIGAVCSFTAPSTLTVSGGFTTARSPSGTTIKIQLQNFQNPRGTGPYNIPVNILTTVPAACQYASGNANYIVTTASNIAATIIPLESNRNLFTSYKVQLTPNHLNWYVGDKITVAFPPTVPGGTTSHTIPSATLNCVSISTNVVSISCAASTTNPGTEIDVAISINQVAYTASRLIEFNIDYIQNPDRTGLLGGFQVVIMTPTNMPFVSDPVVDVVYSDYVTVPDNKKGANFASNLKGDFKHISYWVQSTAMIPSGSKFLVTFEQGKWQRSNNETLRTSSPVMTLAMARRLLEFDDKADGGRLRLLSINQHFDRELQAGFTATLQTAAAIPPNTNVSFAINQKNPVVDFVGTPDANLELQINNRRVFRTSPLITTFDLKCTEPCKICENIHTYCTACFDDKVLQDNTCIEPLKDTLVGISAPFIFTTCALVLLLLIWIFGRCLRNRNFSGNFYYACLRFIYFAAIIGTIIQLYINKDARLYTYIFLGILGLHFVLSLMSGRSFKAVKDSREFGGCQIEGVPRAGNPGPLFFKSAQEAVAFKLAEAMKNQGTERDSAYVTKLGKEKEQTKLYKVYSHQLFMFFFHHQSTRIFFSSVSKEKIKDEQQRSVEERALFWTWNQDTFKNLTRSYERHQKYYLLLQFIIVGVLVFSCLGLYAQAYIYLFKFDIICLSIIDYLAYTYAWNELNPRPQKKGARVDQDASMMEIKPLTKLDDEDVVNLNESRSTLQNLDVFYDEDGKVVGRMVNGTLTDDEGREILINKREHRILVDENGTIRMIYDKNGRLLEEYGFRVERDKNKNKLLYNKSDQLVARFNQKGDLIDKNSQVILTHEEVTRLRKNDYILQQNGEFFNKKTGLYYDPDQKLNYKKSEDGERYYQDEKTKRYFLISPDGERLYHDPITGLLYKEGKDGKPIFCEKSGNPYTKDQLSRLVREGKLRIAPDGSFILNNKYVDPSIDQLESILEQDSDGVFRPKLKQKEAPRHKMKDDPMVSQELKQSFANGQCKQRKFDDDTTKVDYIQDHANTSENLRSNLEVDRDLARRNEKFDKWWYTADNNYLEVIYEEDDQDENGKLYENPDYDEQDKRKIMNNLVRPNGNPLGNDMDKLNVFKQKQKTALEAEQITLPDEQEREFENRNREKSKRHPAKDTETEDSVVDKEVTRENSNFEKSIISKQDPGLTDVRITSNKNQYMNNTSSELSLKDDSVRPKALTDKEGYFEGTNGKKYKFDKNFNMVDKKGMPQALDKVPDLIGNFNVDRVPNIPRKYTSSYPSVKHDKNGFFKANDGELYKFDTNGNMLNEAGEVIPTKQGKELVDQLNVDGVPNCPNKYMLDLVRPIVSTNERDFYAADAKLHYFDPKGIMRETEGLRELKQPEVEQKIKGLDLDCVPSIPNNLKISPDPVAVTNAKFIANDGKPYKFDAKGRLIDDSGQAIGSERADKILKGLNLDNVENVPERYKTDAEKPTKVSGGLFIAPDGKKYRFDDDGNLLDEKGNLVSENDADNIIRGSNCDDIPNSPNKFRSTKIPEAPMIKRDGTFAGQDGKNYRFDKNGNLVNEQGDTVPDALIPGVLNGIVTDSIPNCPAKYKKKKVPVVDKNGFWQGADGQKYRFTPNGELVNSDGKAVPREQIHQKLKGMDFTKLPNIPIEAIDGNPDLISESNPFGTIARSPCKFFNCSIHKKCSKSVEKSPDKRRGQTDSDAHQTQLGSVTAKSRKDKNMLPQIGDTMFVNLLADESFDLDVNVEEIDDEEYNAENEHAYAQPYIKQFPEYVFDNSKEGSSEGGNSRLARFAQLNLDSTTSAANSEKKRNSNGKPGFDPRGYLVTPNEKLPLRQGYREVLTNTESQRERTFDPNDRERRYSHVPRSSLGDHKRKYATMTKKKRHPDGRPDSSSSSFGTLVQNQLDKQKGLTSGIGFIKPYKRKQMNRTSSNMSNDKLLSIKQIYIDNIEKEKSKNPYSRTQSRTNIDDF